MKAPTPKQLRARELFAQRARSGAFKRKAGARSARRKPNPVSEVAQTILAQLGGQRFLAMTGAKHLLADAHSLAFTLPARAARDGINKVRVTLQPDDRYTVQFMRYAPRSLKVTMVKQLDGVYADSLREAFTTYTGLHVSLGTMGRPRQAKTTRAELDAQRMTAAIQRAAAAPQFGDPGTTFYLSTASGRWVTGVSGSDPNRISTGAWGQAIAMSAERAAIVKARLESQGHQVQVVPVERIEVNPRRRGQRTPMMGTRVPDEAFKGYLIRQAGDGSLFIEKDRVFIGWARDRDDARRTIAYLVDPDQRDRNPAALQQNPGRRVRSVEVWNEDGGFEYGMDDRTPQLFHFTTLARKSRKAYMRWALPPSVVANDAFQAWAREHHQVGIYTLPQLKAKLKQWVSAEDLARQRAKAEA